MNNETTTKNKFWKGVLVGVLVTAFAGLMIVGTAAGILLVGHAVINNKAGQMANSQQESEGTLKNEVLDYSRIKQKSGMLKRIIDQYFLFEENVDADKMETEMYKGMLRALDDPYTVYYTPDEYNTLMESTDGSYCGIGAVVTKDVESGIITIVNVFPDSPAEKAGVQKGDIICKVNGIDAASMDLDLLVSREVRGEKGTNAQLELLRDQKTVEISVTRDIVELETVGGKMLSDGETGYVEVLQFQTATTNQFKKAITDLEKQGMKQMIIDLRDNPGGIVDVAVEMMAYLLPNDDRDFDGTLISMKDKYGNGGRYFFKDGKIQYEKNEGTNYQVSDFAEDDHEVDLPIVILVNGDSASASEVFSGAMKEYKCAKIVGTTTFGKGIVQAVIPLGDGSAVKMTTAHYYTPSGSDIHKKGIDPDVEVEFELPEDYDGTTPFELEDDNQIQKALEVLNNY